MAKYKSYDAIKDPKSILDYGRNWGDSCDNKRGWLHINEVIVTSDWEVKSDREKVPTLVVSQQGTGISDDRKMTAVFLEGGTANILYKLTNHITTLDPNGNKRTERMTGIVKCYVK